MERLWMLKASIMLNEKDSRQPNVENVNKASKGLYGSSDSKQLYCMYE
jgi:hypothetical protein